MGTYLNPDNENFSRALSRNVYVDKTMMIAVVNSFMDADNSYICVSRPRRFGKTMAGNMLSAYFSKGCDSRALFEPYKIHSDPSFKKRLNKLNVIKIDVNGEYQMARDKAGALDRLSGKIIRELQEEFPQVKLDADFSLGEAIQEVYAKTKERFVIIMDEYDALARESVPRELFSQYLSFLNGLFKNDTLRPAIALAYLTGILPIARDRVQSKLNNFSEYSILSAGPLAEFMGFTDQEVKALCERSGLSFEECKRWYDGYSLNGMEIYNPESVVRSIENKEFSDYWGKTSTYAVISDRIRQNFEGTKDDVVRMLSGESVEVNVTRFMNTVTDFSSRGDVFTYLIHLGYLAYDKSAGACRIPNREVRNEWFNAIEGEQEYAVTNKIIQDSKELLSQTLLGNEDAVAKALDKSHIHVASNRSYNNEDALQSAIYLAYIYALNKYTVAREMTAGKGFVDVVFIPYVPDVPAMIVELKRNGSADSAIKQIQERRYFESLEKYSGNLLFVGINYDENTKAHSCKIERLVK